MLVYDIYRFIGFVLREEEYGGVYDPDDFNRALEVTNNQFFLDKSEECLKKQEEATSDAILSSKYFRELSVNTGLAPTAGVYNIASFSQGAFARWMSATCTTDNMTREIELVSEQEKQRRMSNLLAPDGNDYPFAVLKGSSIYVYPTTITSISFTYLKHPDTPFMDYYTTSSYVLVGMTAGATVNIPSGGTYRDGTAGPVSKVSITVELVYEKDVHIEFLALLLKWYGLSLDKQAVSQYMDKQQLQDKAI